VFGFGIGAAGSTTAFNQSVAAANSMLAGAGTSSSAHLVVDAALIAAAQESLSVLNSLLQNPPGDGLVVIEELGIQGFIAFDLGILSVALPDFFHNLMNPIANSGGGGSGGGGLDGLGGFGGGLPTGGGVTGGGQPVHGPGGFGGG
jgi:hypothetical protein